jgi:hypothetical protein
VEVGVTRARCRAELLVASRLFLHAEVMKNVTVNLGEQEGSENFHYFPLSRLASSPLFYMPNFFIG